MGSCLSLDGEISPSFSPLPASGRGQRSRRSSRRRRSGLNSFDSKEEEQLRKVPGRTFLNGSSSVASLFTRQGKKGINQDAMIVWENFASRTDTIFCGVFDGHGPSGHIVARRVRDLLPLRLCAHWGVNISHNDTMRQNSSGTTGSMNSEEACSFVEVEPWASPVFEEQNTHPEIFLTLKESFLKAFKIMDKELQVNPNIDCFYSGTTAVTLVKQGQDLVIGNIGDSRAVLGTRGNNDSLIAVQLTEDLKPSLPREAERIRRCKGRVFALQDEPEVTRVWLPDTNLPGLAMARAFGDFCLKNFGLISVPEVHYHRLTEKDEFIVLATDGIWDVLSNKEVVDIVASAPARSVAARALVESAIKAWKYKYPTSKIDDCAVVCLFLDMSSDNYSTATAKAKEQHSIETVNVDNCEKPLSNGSATLLEESEISLQSDSQIDEDQYSDESNSREEWLALEGVSRANTLLTLPRAVATQDDKASRNDHVLSRQVK